MDISDYESSKYQLIKGGNDKMSKAKKSLKTAAAIATAGKLSFASHTIHADFTNGSKANQLSISQGETTRWIVDDPDNPLTPTTLPLLEIDQNNATEITPKGEGSRGASKAETNIFAGSINLDQFDGVTGELIVEKFVVSGINSKDAGPLDVYLVMSPNRSDGSGWSDTAAGFMLLDPLNFEVIGKATVAAVKSLGFPNSLASEDSPQGGVIISGNVDGNTGGPYPTVLFSIPIERKNFDLDFFSTNAVYIQAIAFPVDTVDWADAVVSPLYMFDVSDSEPTPNNK